MLKGTYLDDPHEIENGCKRNSFIAVSISGIVHVSASHIILSLLLVYYFPAKINVPL